MTENWIATVRVAVDFTDAENVWVVTSPVYEGESIPRALREAGERVIDSLARDAGSLFADRSRYGQGLLR